jgi:DNA-binding response OmpR family regulator
MNIDDTPPQPESRVAFEPTSVSRRILIVDDDAGIRMILAELLGKSGYRTDCTHDGEAGWDALRTSRFDALITDHDMPRLTGLDLIRRLRTCSPKLPVILMSGRLPWSESNLIPIISPGMALKKPFSLTELLVKLRCILIPADLQPTQGGSAINARGLWPVQPAALGEMAPNFGARAPY